MSVFFQFIAAFALFFGVAALVFATEFSKRAKVMIDARFGEIDAKLARKLHNQDLVLEGAVQEMRRSLKEFEEAQFAQTREINALRKALEALQGDIKKREEQIERLQLAGNVGRRRG